MAEEIAAGSWSRTLRAHIFSQVQKAERLHQKRDEAVIPQSPLQQR